MKYSLVLYRARPRISAPAFPTAFCTDNFASDLALKEYGVRCSYMAYAFSKEKNFSLVGSKKDYEKIGQFFLDKFLRNKKYLDNVIEWSEKHENALVEFLEEKLSREKMEKLSNKDLAKIYNDFAELYRFVHMKNTPQWWIGAEAVENEIKKYLNGKSIGADLSELVSSPYKCQTENFKEEISFLDILIDLKSMHFKKVDSLDTLPSKIRAKIEKHIKKFSSLPYGYISGIVWDEKYYLKKINNFLLHKGDPREIKLNKIKTLKEQIKKKEEKIKKLKLPEKIVNLTRTLGQLAYLQEIKKTTQTRCHPYLWSVVYAEIARRLNLKLHYFRYFSVYEVEKSLLKGNVDKKTLEELAEREKSAVLIMKDLKYHWLYGKKAQNFLAENCSTENDNSVKELKGIVASKGCHAAIISRELALPCIIGTKIATSVLHDGDIVEVDANKGIVKILK